MTGDIGLYTQSFTYDGLGLVTGSSGLTQTSTYSYDLDSDRLTRVDGATSTTFTYDWTGELYQQTISGSKTFAYDRYGNLTTAWDASSQSITYAYDEASRPTGITPQTGSAATLAPDALDRTKTRVVGASTDTYGYLGPSTTTYETATTDALLDVDGSRLAVKTGSTLSWVIFDLHGSVVGLCPAGSTTLSDAYRYDAWGQPLASSGSATNPWRYRGLLDLSPNSVGFYMLAARMYSSALAAFTQEDTVQGTAVDPISMNRYLYAEADPQSLIDPDGHAVTTNNALCSPYNDFCTQGSMTKPAYNAKSKDYNPAPIKDTSYCSRFPAECPGTASKAHVVANPPAQSGTEDHIATTTRLSSTSGASRPTNECHLDAGTRAKHLAAGVVLVAGGGVLVGLSALTVSALILDPEEMTLLELWEGGETLSYAGSFAATGLGFGAWGVSIAATAVTSDRC